MAKYLHKVCYPHVQLLRIAESDAKKTLQTELWQKRKQQAAQGD